jgi:CRP-like cAMP-binding protein
MPLRPIECPAVSPWSAAGGAASGATTQTPRSGGGAGPRLGEVLTIRRGAQLGSLDGPGRDGVIGVLSGTLRSCRVLMDGRRQITAFLFPGDWCWLDERRGHWTMVEAVTDARVTRTTRRQLAAAGPGGAGAMEEILDASLAAALDRVVTLGQKSARDKLAAFLVDMSGRLAGGAAEFRLPMSRYDIADYLGLRSETVCRTFAQLAADCVVALPEPQLVRILDREALQAVMA